ncbi:Superfamily II helicase [Archaeoglobus sulfaticallidus PM70-1]|uniref:ATP-dependent DNA helicase Hel308 n=1 Tax=Archaeoglobus sulfaticallidus PM70-1 TaxID=387631 RepID=N0BIC2_9EURY|nr:DEAD/DEAH box helicase [Archaeoglobus sulfaticallidus]AGK62027.1 Superfamily II helicase [Archaeoglobus sulfaticallidus PM70-1]
MRVSELEEYISPFSVKILEDRGIRELFPPQKEVIELGLFSRKNFVISIPTASGKTLIAELAMVREIMEGGKCLYIVPLRALASEKFEEFSIWEKIGIKTGYSVGDYESKDEWLGECDIIITTSEKADSFLRNSASWIKKISCIVVDEIHLIDSFKRGPVLEILIAKMRKINPDIRIIGLSATIPNSEEIAGWLDAELYTSEWRPTELYEGVYLRNRLELFHNGECRVKRIDGGLDALIAECLEDGGQVLVFDSTRRNAESTAVKISKITKKFVGDEVDEIANAVLEENDGDMSKKLSECIKKGSAFHHAGLLNSQRKTVEDAFKSNLIKVLVATPTLSAGVNLPARRVIIKSYHRFEPNLGNVPIKVLEYKQMAGRAGRPGLDPVGEAIVIVRSSKEKEKVIQRFIHGTPEDIESKLKVEKHLRFHILSIISEGFAKDFRSLSDFFSLTFFFYQNGIAPDYEIKRVLNQLENWGFITQENLGFVNLAGETGGGGLAPTELGKLVSKLYIDPLTGFIFYDTLEKFDDLSEVAILHTLCRTPDMETLYIRKYDDWVEELADKFRNELTYFPSELSTEYDWFLSEFKTAMCLYEWISEVDEDLVCSRYNISPGDLRRITETAEWLIYSFRRIANFLDHPVQSELVKLESRIKYGIKDELIDLIEVKGIGRARARKLYNYGIRSKEDLLENRAKVSELIGKKWAERIIGEITGEKDFS